MSSEKKIMLNCDYTDGAHPNIMKKMMETNLLQTEGYGMDEICDQARKFIKKHLKNDKVDIHFLIGGTSANQIVISSSLRPFEAVISIDSGHINAHETGAIETTGHKIISITKELKITAEMIEKFCVIQEKNPISEHMVMAKMVYISLPTEFGLLYSKSELEQIYSTCKKHNLYLFVDGARLAYALAAYEKTNLKIEDLPNLCDVMYIGGTKCGALFGEAVVIMNEELKKYFRHNIKLRGGMLAKGRLLGIQFYELFKDNLYFEIGKYSVDLAMYLKEELKKKGVKLYIDSYTNQQFVVINKKKFDEINKTFILSLWEEIEEGYVVRICTSWSTKKETIDKLLSLF